MLNMYISRHDSFMRVVSSIRGYLRYIRLINCLAQWWENYYYKEDQSLAIYTYTIYLITKIVIDFLNFLKCREPYG